MEAKLKKRMAAFFGLALMAATGVAQAETRLAVQDAAGTTDKMVVTDSGYIGIGGVNPTTAVWIKGTTYASSSIISQYTGNDQYAAGSYLTLRNDLASDGKTPLLPKANERLGYFSFGSLSPTAGVGNLFGAGLSAYAEVNWTDTSIPSFFAFETVPSGSKNKVERMRVNSAGYVGIGLPSTSPNPTQKLDVNGAFRLNTPYAVPATCTDALRGVIWMYKNPNTTGADSLSVCTRDSSGNLAWRNLY